jgi:PAS domain S-box-containing protein
MTTLSKFGKLSSSLLSFPKGEEFQALLEISPNPIFIVNTKQNIFQLTNTAAVHATGYMKDELNSMDATDVFPKFLQLKPFSLTNAHPIQDTEFTKRNGSTEKVSVEMRYLDSRKEWLLLNTSLYSTQKHQLNDDSPEQINARELIKLFSYSTKADALLKFQHSIEKLLNVKSSVILQNNDDETYSTIDNSISINPVDKKYIPYLHNCSGILGGPKEIASLQQGKMLSIFTKENSNYLLFLIDNIFIDLTQKKELLHHIFEILEQIDKSYETNRFKTTNGDESKIKNILINTMKTSTEDGLLFVSPNLEIKEVNKQIEAMLGYRPNEIIGRKLKEILISAGGELDIKSIGTVTNTLLDFGEFLILKRNSQSVPVKIKAIGIYRDAKVFLILVRILDLTEYERIKSKEKKLEQNALLGDLMSIFAHDVRNPIQNINTGLELLSMDLEEKPDLQGDISNIREDGQRLITLMDSVLSFSKSFEYKMESQDLNILIGGLLIRMRNVFLKSNVQQYFSPMNKPSMIKGDEKSLVRVFENIFVNAINAMEMQISGNVGVEINEIIDEFGIELVEVKITDTGPGIPENDLNKIFLPFYSTSRKGTGLGLAITKRTIDAHRGHISVETVAGGTIFSIRLPKL